MVMKNKLFAATALGSLLFSWQVNAAEIERNTAQMQAMDKITGRVSVVEVPVNSEVSFGSFSIVVRACKSTPPEETPENYAFVDVADSSFGKMQFNIFKGWMMSSSPALNAVEHPIYDVWLLKCIDTKVDPTKLLSEEKLKERDALPRLADIKQEAGNQVSEDLTNVETEQQKSVEQDETFKVVEEDKTLENYTQPAEVAEQKAEDETISLDAAEPEKQEEPLELEATSTSGPQSLLNIVEEPQEQNGNNVPEAVEPAQQSDDWEELPPATELPKQPEVQQPLEVEKIGEQDSAPSDNEEMEEAGSVPEVLPEDEEDQFIDFSSQSDATEALEAELSAEALKE